MKKRPRYKMEDIAKSVGLTVDYVDDLPQNVTGFLDPQDPPRFIAVSSRLSANERAFTIAHELGHLVVHRQHPPVLHYPKWLDHPWRNPRIAAFVAEYKQFINEKFNPDWDADLYAFILFNITGYQDELKAHLQSHPEKTGWALLTTIIVFLGASKQRTTTIFKYLFSPRKV